MNGGGPGSGVWKSIDGGDTWTRLTDGFPAGSLGRIGLDVYRRNGTSCTRRSKAPGGGGRGAAAARSAPKRPSALPPVADVAAAWR